MSEPQLPIQTAILNRFRDMLRLDRYRRRQIGNGPTNLKYPNKELLCMEHAFREFVPQVIVGWEELATIGA